MVSFSISTKTVAALEALAFGPTGDGGSWHRHDTQALGQRLLECADWDFDGPARMFEAHVRRSCRGPLEQVQRSTIAAMALDLPSRIAALDLPRSIVDLYPQAVDRLATYLSETGAYDPDHRAKDVRFVIGATVPAGGQVIDLHYANTPFAIMGRFKRAAASGVRLLCSHDHRGLSRYLAASATRPFLQIHTEARDLSRFCPAGWDQTYLYAADLLDRFPEYGGLLNSSWFFDPVVAEISPRLAYLQERHLEGGAIRIRLGTSPLQVQSATAKSETRLALYREGRYEPTCYAFFWPRKEIISWAGQARGNLRVGAFERSVPA